MDYERFDAFATEVFGPIYPEIAAKILERTGIRSGSLLDVGCGGGHLGFAMMALGSYDTTFCDVSDEMLTFTRKRGESLHRDCRYVQGDVQHLDFPDNSFDLIISRGSMPFWPDQLQAFRELHRVLKPGGKAYIGGGLASKAHRDRIIAEMERRKDPDKKPGPSSTMTLDTPAYETLLRELGAPYQVIENEDEGRWFLFGKGGSSSR